MTKKEKIDLLLSKVQEEQKAAFISELRETNTKEARQTLFKKYGITLSKEEIAALMEVSTEVADEDLDKAAGGCCNPTKCKCGCSTGCA